MTEQNEKPEPFLPKTRAFVTGAILLAFVATIVAGIVLHYMLRSGLGPASD